MNEAQRIDRARRAGMALDEFLTPAFDRIHAAYSERMEEVVAKEPWATEKIKALVTALRVAREAHKQIVAVVQDGEQAKAERIRTEAIERISPARRRVLGI